MHDPIPFSPERIITDVLANDRRVLLFGESGIGKSTLAAGLAKALALTSRPCTCISADPGSPAFGVPGALCLGRWHDDAWQLQGLEPLCTLDAGRFRLPLVSAVRLLAAGVDQGTVLLDAPGVVRGIAGAELLNGLVEAAVIDTVLVLCHDIHKLPLINELSTLACDVIPVQASAAARSLPLRKRARLRTLLWDEYLLQARDRTILFSETQFTGTPPPLHAVEHWGGRQIALLKGGKTIAMGEVLRIENDVFHVRITETQKKPDQILCRDACRNRQGSLATAKPASGLTVHYIPPPDVALSAVSGEKTGPLPVARIGEATAILVNGIFGDPLLHLRLHNRKKSILFDLGEGSRLPARLAHQVSHVFISHAHIDHISGFFWLMRSRIGSHPPCILFGPPGLAEHVEGLINGIHWDRIGDWGPRFTVAEFNDEHLALYDLQAGSAESRKYLGDTPVQDGLILQEPHLKVWAVTLDHGGIPVLAYRLEQAPRYNVRKDRLSACNLAAGPWLRELKQLISGGDRLAQILLPDGTACSCGELADSLLQITPPQRLVYATDIADTPANRQKLVTLAQGAHIFFCEAAFLEADRINADRSGHLTARGCGEIAQAAAVELLVPFHFSRRYEHGPVQVFNEVKLYTKRVIPPKSFGIIPD